MCLELRVRERPVLLQLCNRYFGDRLIPGAVQGEMALDTEIATALVDELAARRPIHLDSVRVDMALRRGTRLLELERARGPKRVRRGQQIRVRATARPPRGEARSFSFAVRVPRKLAGAGTAWCSPAAPRRPRSSCSASRGRSRWSGCSPGCSRPRGPGWPRSEDEAESVPITNFRELEKQLAKLRRYPGIRARFVRIAKDEESVPLELLEELFGDLDPESEKKAQRVYRDPVYGVGGSAAYRLRVVGRRVARGKRD